MIRTIATTSLVQRTSQRLPRPKFGWETKSTIDTHSGNHHYGERVERVQSRDHLLLTGFRFLSLTRSGFESRRSHSSFRALEKSREPFRKSRKVFRRSRKAFRKGAVAAKVECRPGVRYLGSPESRAFTAVLAVEVIRRRSFFPVASSPSGRRRHTGEFNKSRGYHRRRDSAASVEGPEPLPRACVVMTQFEGAKWSSAFIQTSSEVAMRRHIAASWSCGRLSGLRSGSSHLRGR